MSFIKKQSVGFYFAALAAEQAVSSNFSAIFVLPRFFTLSAALNS